MNKKKLKILLPFFFKPQKKLQKKKMDDILEKSRSLREKLNQLNNRKKLNGEINDTDKNKINPMEKNGINKILNGDKSHHNMDLNKSYVNGKTINGVHKKNGMNITDINVIKQKLKERMLNREKSNSTYQTDTKNDVTNNFSTKNKNNTLNGIHPNLNKSNMIDFNTAYLNDSNFNNSTFGLNDTANEKDDHQNELKNANHLKNNIPTVKKNGILKEDVNNKNNVNTHHTESKNGIHLNGEKPLYNTEHQKNKINQISESNSDNNKDGDNLKKNSSSMMTREDLMNIREKIQKRRINGSHNFKLNQSEIVMSTVEKSGEDKINSTTIELPSLNNTTQYSTSSSNQIYLPTEMNGINSTEKAKLMIAIRKSDDKATKLDKENKELKRREEIQTKLLDNLTKEKIFFTQQIQDLKNQIDQFESNQKENLSTIDKLNEKIKKQDLLISQIQGKKKKEIQKKKLTRQKKIFFLNREKLFL